MKIDAFSHTVHYPRYLNHPHTVRQTPSAYRAVELESRGLETRELRQMRSRCAESNGINLLPIHAAWIRKRVIVDKNNTLEFCRCVR